MVLGIDVGGTKIIALKMDGLNVIKKWEIGTINGEVIHTLNEIIDDAKESDVGIGLPCYIKDGICVKAPNISEFDGMDLKKIFENAAVMNDCTAMAYGEYVLRDEHYRSLLLVALGTGVGAGLVFNGVPYVGHGSAMELGHIKGFSERKCFCGKEGCLETVLGGKYENLEYIELRARGGDVSSIKFMENYGKILGNALSCAVELLDPEIIVFGGSVSHAYDLFIDPLKETLRRNLSFIDVDDIIFDKVKSPYSGAIGAAIIADRKLI